MYTVLKAPLQVLDRMTEDEFYRFCGMNPNLPVERNKQGQLLLMSPTGSKTGLFDLLLGFTIETWNRQQHLGKTFGSGAGFTLPDTSIKSADVAWIANVRWEAVPADDQRRFAHICPDFVAEIKSPSDSWPDLQQKMHEWRENGCRLGWLIDPENEKIEIYTLDQPYSGNWKEVSGGDVLPGLTCNLTEVFA